MSKTVKNGKGSKSRTKDHKAYWMSEYWELLEKKKKKESKNEKSNRS